MCQNPSWYKGTAPTHAGVTCHALINHAWANTVTWASGLASYRSATAVLNLAKGNIPKGPNTNLLSKGCHFRQRTLVSEFLFARPVPMHYLGQLLEATPRWQDTSLGLTGWATLTFLCEANHCFKSRKHSPKMPGPRCKSWMHYSLTVYRAIKFISLLMQNWDPAIPVYSFTGNSGKCTG